MANWDDLSTVKFQRTMKPHAMEIYKAVFPGCEIEDLRENGVKVHVLDREFGIDMLLRFSGKQWISVQEKYRSNEALLKYCDFTQEYKNAEGTEYESDGEWFKLGAQLYFYGWANVDNSGFEKWFIMDIAKYKLIIESSGGIEMIGRKFRNDKNGRASFYAIPIGIIKPAFVVDYRNFRNGIR